MSAYSTVDLRKYLGDVLGRAHHAQEKIQVLHHGKPYAAVVSEQDGEFLQSLESLQIDTDSLVQFINHLPKGRKINLRELTEKMRVLKTDVEEPSMHEGTSSEKD